MACLRLSLRLFFSFFIILILVKTGWTLSGPLGELVSAGALVSDLWNANVSTVTTWTHLASAGALVSNL